MCKLYVWICFFLLIHINQTFFSSSEHQSCDFRQHTMYSLLIKQILWFNYVYKYYSGNRHACGVCVCVSVCAVLGSATGGHHGSMPDFRTPFLAWWKVLQRVFRSIEGGSFWAVWKALGGVGGGGVQERGAIGRGWERRRKRESVCTLLYRFTVCLTVGEAAKLLSRLWAGDLRSALWLASRWWIILSKSSFNNSAVLCARSDMLRFL